MNSTLFFDIPSVITDPDEMLADNYQWPQQIAMKEHTGLPKEPKAKIPHFYPPTGLQ